MKKLSMFILLLFLSFPLFATMPILKPGDENDFINIYGKYKNEIYQNELYFNLVQNYFIVGAEIKYKNFSLKCERLFIHPALSNYSSDMLYGGYNKIEFKITSKGIICLI